MRTQSGRADPARRRSTAAPLPVLASFTSRHRSCLEQLAVVRRDRIGARPGARTVSCTARLRPTGTRTSPGAGSGTFGTHVGHRWAARPPWRGPQAGSGKRDEEHDYREGRHRGETRAGGPETVKSRRWLASAVALMFRDLRVAMSAPALCPSINLLKVARSSAMAGHSKWKQIKRKKAVTDAKPRLVVDQAHPRNHRRRQGRRRRPRRQPPAAHRDRRGQAANMPNDNIERAIKKGTGELEGASYEELTYEGYGPGGAAIFIEATTDNANRTVAEIRHAFSRNGGNLGASNSVAWMFDRKGQIYPRRQPVRRGRDARGGARSRRRGLRARWRPVRRDHRAGRLPRGAGRAPGPEARDRVGRARDGAEEHRQGRGQPTRSACCS